MASKSRMVVASASLAILSAAAFATASDDTANAASPAKQESAGAAAPAGNDQASAASSGQAAEGGDLFKANCRLCHGSKGSAGVPLAGNGKLASGEYVAQMVIRGAGYMPAFGPNLEDAQIAAIVTYVRTSWGNDFGPFTADEVAAQR